MEKYLFPRHPSEIDRLDIQHFALRETLGVNHLAPVSEPARVLDVGSGTGQWAYEMCDQIPKALVVGLDLVPSKPGAPANYQFVRANVLQGLPFRDGTFDFVHQRLMAASAVPVKSWSGLVLDLERVTRPGGWIELTEGTGDVEPSGPATGRLIELMRRLGRSLGLDTTGIVVGALDTYLRRTGMLHVERRNVHLPIGEWGGRVGSMMASDFRAIFARLSSALVSSLGLDADECRELIATAQRELEECRSMGTVVIAFGQKPA